MTGLSTGIFGSRVGRRIFLLFALVGLVPLILTIVISQTEMTKEIRREIESNLREDAKSFGMEVLAELKLRAVYARAYAAREPIHASKPIPADVLEFFSAGWVRAADNQFVQQFGAPVALPDVSRINHEHLASGKAQLLDQSSGNTTNWFLYMLEGETSNPKLYVLQLVGEGLWQPRTYVPFRTEYCVLTESGATLMCSEPGDQFARTDIVSVNPGQQSAVSEWRDNEGRKLSAVWPLYLANDFYFSPVSVVATANYDYALRSVKASQRLLMPLSAFVAVLVVFLSIRQIRQNLVPLRLLRDATVHYGAGATESRVELDSDDEFADLANAFNEMAQRIDRQINTLKSMAVVDDQIISGTPADVICSDFLPQLARISGANVCALQRDDMDSHVDASLLIFANGKLTSARLTFAEAIRHTSIAANSMSRPLAVNQLNPALASHFAELKVSYVMVLPLEFASRKMGTVFVSVDSGRSPAAEFLDSCCNLAARLAIGIANSQREEELYKKAHYDELTQLPNRQLLKDRVQQCLQQSELHDSKGAVMFMDIDRFKEVNDVFGHTIGDVLLKEAAARVSSIFDTSVTIARLGGDEFVVLIPEIEDHSQVHGLARKLVQVLAKPFTIRGGDHFLGASVGIAVFPDDGRSVEILLRNSDAAMYRAKHAGRGRYEFFSQKLNEDSQRRFILERDLRAAVARNELELHFQPQFWLADQSLRGAESLLRWNHPKFGAIPPFEFIAIAEQSDLIIDIGRWVLEQACQTLRELLDEGLHPGIIAVNISARQVCDDELLSQVMHALKSNQINPGFLELEVTESIVAHDKDAAHRTLTALQSAGIRIGMDDFGTGYSSLGMLRSLPIDCLKIDRSFVVECNTSDDAASICQAIITMAHSLGKEVVAEGVEIAEHATLLREYECEIGQGYLYAKPMPAAEFRDFVTIQSEHTKRRKKLEIA